MSLSRSPFIRVNIGGFKQEKIYRNQLNDLGALQVGDDEFGYMLCDVLKDQKVETKGIRFDSQARTALAFVTLRDDGEREFMFYRNPSADMLFQINELDIDLLKEVLLCVLWLAPLC